MLELLKGQVAVANNMMSEVKVNTFLLGGISSIDRMSNAVIFRPTEIALDQLTAEEMLIVSLEDGKVLEGNYSSPPDTDIHLAIYRNFPQINSIAHVYPKWTTIYSQAGRNIPVLNKYHAYEFKSEIRCTRALTDGEIAGGLGPEWTVIESMKDMEILDQGGVIVRNDGVVTWGKTPLKSLKCAAVLEKLAKVAWHTEIICNAVPCESMSAVLIEKYYQNNLQTKKKTGEIRAPGNLVTMEEERQIGLEMLAYFDQVCRSHRIKYSLTGGTLLGAIRHRGFIPWDDDVDVFLTRPEYDKLEAAFDDENRFVFINRNKEKDFNYVFGRLVDTKTLITESPNTVSAGKGIFLDICVVDGLPNNFILRKLHIAYMRFLVRGRRAVIQNPENKSYIKKGPLIVFVKKLLRYFTSLEFWNRSIEKAMSRYSFNDSEFVGNFTSQYGKRELLHKSVFDSYIDLPFEDYSFMVCAGYDEYLTNIYGKNYMDFPTKKKRKGHHPNTAYWVE